MDRLTVAIVIPALNEAGTISAVVERVRPFGVPIVIDDGSTDDTAEIATRAGACVVRHERNQGYDAALNTGCAEAAKQGFAYLLTIDADGQHQPHLIATLLAEFERGADIVIGQRNRLARPAERLFALIGRYKWRIADPLCGMKAYKTELYKRLGHLDSYRSVGTELALFAAATGAKVAQVPITVLPRLDQPRFGNQLVANCKILRALFIGLIKF